MHSTIFSYRPIKLVINCSSTYTDQNYLTHFQYAEKIISASFRSVDPVWSWFHIQHNHYTFFISLWSVKMGIPYFILSYEAAFYKLIIPKVNPPIEKMVLQIDFSLFLSNYKFNTYWSKWNDACFLVSTAAGFEPTTLRTRVFCLNS